MIKWLKAMLIFSLLFFTTGCWDSVEIEERGFVVGTALDLEEDDNITLTFQIVLPTQMQGSSGQKGVHPYVNKSSTAKTVFKAVRNLASELSRTPFLSHNQLIIISDKLAEKEHIGEIMDLFIRDPESRRASYVMVSEGRAKDILEVSTELETLPVKYIISTNNNPDKSESITPPITIGVLRKMLLSNMSYVLPKVSRAAENKISTAGASIFYGQDHKFIGHLNPEETTGRNMIQGLVKTAALEIEMDGKEIVIEVLEFFRNIKVKKDERGLPFFEISISANGSIVESELEEDITINKLNKDIKAKGEEKIKQLIEGVIELSQKKYETDFLGFYENMYEQQYELWQKYKDNWDSGEKIFTQCQVNVDVNLNLITIGTITESK